MTICFFGTYDRDYSRNQILLAGLSQHGIEVTEVHVQLKQLMLNKKSHLGIVPILHRLARKLLLLPVVFKHVKTIARSDVLLCAYPGHVDLPLAVLVGKLFGKPVIFDPLYSLTDTFSNDFRILGKGTILGRLFSWSEKILFSLPDGILADTPYQKQLYGKLFNVPAEKIHLVPLGADTAVYTRSMPTAEKITKFRVIYYGLFNPVHGVKYIVEAAHMLREEKDVEFLFIGQGQTYEENVALADRYQLTNVNFLKLTEKEALPYLQTASVFLGLFGKSESVYRTIPNKVLQGLALEKAVIMGDGPAVRSVFERGTHLLLCEPENPQSLAGAILEIKRDAKLKKRLEEEGHRLFIKHFTPKAVARALINAL